MFTGNTTVISLPSDWMVYGELGRTSTSCQAQDCTLVSPLTVALFAGLDSNNVNTTNTGAAY